MDEKKKSNSCHEEDTTDAPSPTPTLPPAAAAECCPRVNNNTAASTAAAATTATATTDTAPVVVLTGKVIHRMHLFPSWKKKAASSSSASLPAAAVPTTSHDDDGQGHHHHGIRKKRRRLENNNNAHNSAHRDDDDDDDDTHHYHTQPQPQQQPPQQPQLHDGNKNGGGGGNDDIDIDDDNVDDLFSGWIFQCSSNNQQHHHQQQQQQEPPLHHYSQQQDYYKQEYILSVPARWTREIAIAISYSCAVHIRRYQILLPAVVSSTSSSSLSSHVNNDSMSSNTRFQKQQQRLLLQVSDQENAIHVETTTSTTTTTTDTVLLCDHGHYPNNHNNDLWTLRQWARLEAVERGIQQATKQEQKAAAAAAVTQQPKPRQCYYDYSLSRLVVECISPVICRNDQDDPFCLLQVAHDDNEEQQQSSSSSSSSRQYACVIVLRGKRHDGRTTTTTCPLSMLPALWPGRVIDSICNIQQPMRWRIPEVLETLNGDINSCRFGGVVPQRVFVVQSSRQIILDPNDLPPPRPLSSSSSSSTTTSSSPTCIVQGRILKVAWVYLENKSSKGNCNSSVRQHQQKRRQHLNYILIRPLLMDCDNEQRGDDNTDQCDDDDDDDMNSNAAYDLVFLTYFPMDTCLQYSLRVGAIVQAANLETLLFCSGQQYDHQPSLVVTERLLQPRRVLAANLRSTVTLLRPASSCLPTLLKDVNQQRQKHKQEHHHHMGNGSMIRNPYRKQEPQESAAMLTTAHAYAGLPYAFVPTKKGRSQLQFYVESFCRFKAKQWCQQNDLLHDAFNSNCKQQSTMSLLEDNLARALIARASNFGTTISNSSINQPKTTSNNRINTIARNPYAEFFYCCKAGSRQHERDCMLEHDDEEERTSRDGDDTGGVDPTASAFTILPDLLTLDQLHETIMKVAQKRLVNEVRQRQQRPDGFIRGLFPPGWTGSFALAADDFSSIKPGSFNDVGSAPSRQAKSGHETSAPWTGGVTLLPLEKSDIAIDMPTTNGHHCLFNLSNGRVTLPIHFTNGAAESTSSLLASVQEGSLVWIEVKSMVVSCVCLGKVPALDENAINHQGLENVRMSHLPSFHDLADIRVHHSWATGKVKVDALGPCSLVEVQGHLFVVSVYVCANRGGSLMPAAPPAGESRVTGTGNDAAVQTKGGAALSSNMIIPKTAVSSIRACLEPTDQEDESSQWIIGMMVRKFFKLTKPRGGLYTGCMLTLSHVPTNSNKLHSPCSLQSIDVKTSVRVDESKRHIVRRGFERLFSRAASRSSSRTIVSDDQITLAMIWWQLACSAQTCAMLSGGWDEMSTSFSLAAAQKLVSIVRIPRSAAHIDPRRGYVRFRCAMKDVSARVVLLETDTSQEQLLPTRRSVQKSPTGRFDFSSSDCFFPGMLEGRCCRVGNIPWGMLTTSPNTQQSGIPTCTLADMHWYICADLRNATRSNMAPSLVRQVCGATFLGISYCRALAECTKCFKALHDPNNSQRNNSKGNNSMGGMNPQNGSTTSSLQQPTFWHLPLPMHTYDNSLHASVNNDNRDYNAAGPTAVGASKSPMNQSVELKTHLQCPSHCNVDLHAAIKWECSGTLDDGTGQAVLYAERDVALTLLGITNPKTVQQIEQGAWREPGGIIFKKVLPPTPQLRAAIEKARALAHNAAFRGQQQQQQQYGQHQPPGRRPLQEDDVLQFLTPTHRAEYLLQRHCRARWQSSPYFGNNNNKSYLVRCKPLADEVNSSLNHAEITTVAAAAAGGAGYNHQSAAANRKVSTYALPPLKLNLVDMAISSNSSSSLADNGS